MELNKKYTQIRLHSGETREDLRGKIVENVGFTNIGDADENMFIITFTDNTYIAIGTHYKDIDNYNDEPQLENFIVLDPIQINSGCHSYRVDSDNTIHFDYWVDYLRKFGIWDITPEEVDELIEKKKQKENEREYQQYLRLKEKFENNEGRETTD